MFKIINGEYVIKQQLFQWDADIYLDTSDFINKDYSLYVHFVNSSKPDDILSLEAIDGKVQIPNQILVHPGTLNVYAYMDEKTLIKKDFCIIARPKPPSYIDDPTPVITYPELEELVETMRAISQAWSEVGAEIENDVEPGENPYVVVSMESGHPTFSFHMLAAATVDSTLTHQGQAADAKATGGALATKMNNNNPTGTGSLVVGTGHTIEPGKVRMAAINHTNTVSESYAFASGNQNVASGSYSRAEGLKTTASNNGAHSDGQSSFATGKFSHTEGQFSRADKDGAFSGGYGTVSSGLNSFVIGRGTKSNKNYQFVCGVRNVDDPTNLQPTEIRSKTHIRISGNGTYSGELSFDDSTRTINDQAIIDDIPSNAEALDWNGNLKLAGDVYVHCDPDSTGGTKLVSETGLSNYHDNTKMNVTNPTGSGTFRFGTDTLAKSSNSIAQGNNTVAGGGAFTILAVSGTASQRILTLDSVEGLNTFLTEDLIGSAYLKDVNDSYTNNFDSFGKIVSISGTSVTFDGGFDWPSVSLDSEESSHLWIIGRPELGTRIVGDYAISLGLDNVSQNEMTLCSGRQNIAAGKYSVATGRQNKATGYGSRADGRQNTASGMNSFATGRNNIASGDYSGVSGRYNEASGIYSNASGRSTVASGSSAEASGYFTKASGDYAHAEGLGDPATSTYLVASGKASHAEGFRTEASGISSHAEGERTKAAHEGSHVEGLRSETGNSYQHVAGKDNVVKSGYARITGWGTSASKKNIEELDTNGNLFISGMLSAKGFRTEGSTVYNITYGGNRVNDFLVKPSYITNDGYAIIIWNVREDDIAGANIIAYPANCKFHTLFTEGGYCVDVVFAASSDLQINLFN